DRDRAVCGRTWALGSQHPRSSLSRTVADPDRGWPRSLHPTRSHRRGRGQPLIEPARRTATLACRCWPKTGVYGGCSAVVAVARVIANGSQQGVTVTASQTNARETIRTFWARDGAAYDAADGHGIGSADEQARWRALLAELPEGARAADVGAGTGFVAMLLAELGHEVIALDQSGEMLAEARRKAAAADLEVRFEIADVEQLPLDDDSVDIVTARHVLWTLLDPERAFGEWHRVLRPSGVAIADLSLGRRSAHYDEDVEAALPLRGVEDAA